MSRFLSGVALPTFAAGGGGGGASFPFMAIVNSVTGTYPQLANGSVNYDLLTDSSGSAPFGITYQLPAVPVDGQVVRIRDISGGAAPVGTFINLDASLSAGNIVAPGFPGPAGTAVISVIAAYGWVEVTWDSTLGLWYQTLESGSGGGGVGPGTFQRLSKFDGTGTNVINSELGADGSGNLQFASDKNLLPDVANSCELGTDLLPFRRIRAQEIVSGDHVFDNPTIGVTLRMMEHREHLLVLRDEKTGKLYKLNLTEIDT